MSLLEKLNSPAYKDVNRDKVINILVSAGSESKARETLDLNRREFKQLLNYYQIAPKPLGELYSVAALNENMGRVNYFTNQSQNLSDITGNIQKSLDYADGDDIVGGMVDQLRDLTLSGMSLSASPEEIEDVMDFTDAFDVKGIVREMLYKGIATDNMLLYGQVKGKKIVSLSAIEASQIRITPLNEIKDGVPLKKAEISEKGKYREISKNEFLETWSMRGTRDRLVLPSMARVFDSIELRRLIKDGDSTVFLFIQRLIHQIKIGTKDTGTAYSRIRNGINKLTETKAQQIIQKLERANKAMIEVTPPDWEHSFVHPPKELWESSKYEAPEMRIAQWSRIAPILSSGQGANFSGGYIYLKGLGGKIAAYRERVSAMLQFVYKMYGGFETVKINFNQLILKEHAQILKEVEFLKQHYGMSPRLAFNALGYDWQIHENDMATLFSEEENQKLYIPFFEPSQGMLTPGSMDNNPNDVPRTE